LYAIRNLGFWAGRQGVSRGSRSHVYAYPPSEAPSKGIARELIKRKIRRRAAGLALGHVFEAVHDLNNGGRS
jgi:hypothetical protein